MAPLRQSRPRPPSTVGGGGRRAPELPKPFLHWFAERGWRLRPHQVAVLKAAREKRHVLLTAPTGGGKTLAGFLPSLVELTERPRLRGLHTLYLSPLKALAVDVARNVETPAREMGLPVRIEVRTGDTPQNRRTRQRTAPPDILLTTPEQLALLLSYREAPDFFGQLECVIVDELHALTHHKRGDLLSLGLARLSGLAPAARRIGLSATVHDPDMLGRWLGLGEPVFRVDGGKGPRPEIRVLSSKERVPWSGHMTMHAWPEVYAALRQAQTALVFVNTRLQAEVAFQQLWRINEDNLAIALHHGSLAPEQRRKVEAAMARGALRAVVCTSTLDLGVDWGAVDLVIQIGAPKGLSRMVQRVGRANHRLDEPSRALLVPSNRFETLECQAAAEAVEAGELDGEEPRPGALDVLAQHVLGVACAAPFAPDALFVEVRRTQPYAALERATFDRVVNFVATGGYALRRYERWRRLERLSDGRFAIAGAQAQRQYRMNVGAIVEAPMLRVRLKGGRDLGMVEEHFVEQLSPGDTFVFAGEVLRFEGLRELAAIVTRATAEDPKVPAYDGGKFPLSTFLAQRVRELLAAPKRWRGLPQQVQDWLGLQRWRSELPNPGELLVETFPRGKRWFTVAYPFEGRLAHQTLGMLLTRRMERAGLRPLGFVASEYAVCVWSLGEPSGFDALFGEDMLGDDLEEWLADSNLLKRSFRNVAVVAGLIERRHPGQEKTGRQVTFSSDLIYDVLRRYEPDHVLLQATWSDASHHLLDLRRLAALLARIKGRLRHVALDRVSPLAVPLLLDIGREAVPGQPIDEWLGGEAEALIEEASRLV